MRAKGLFGVTAELERERRADFFGEFSLRQLGGAGLVELKASHYTVERSMTDIADAPGDSLCVYQQLGSGAWFGGMRGSDFTIANGSFATSHTDQPYRAADLAIDVAEDIGPLPPEEIDRIVAMMQAAGASAEDATAILGGNLERLLSKP